MAILRTASRMMQRLNETSKVLDLDWFMSNAKRGRVGRQNVAVLRDIIEGVQHVYPDNHDLQVQLTYNRSANKFSLKPIVIIHFDKIDITNREDNHITIYDLFFKIKFNQDGNAGKWFPTDLSGIRTTFTAAQHSSGYTFSHFHTHNPAEKQKWSSMCLGSGGINAVKANLMHKWTKDLWLMFLFEIQTYLEYESLEGGPYVKMSSVNNKDYNIGSQANSKLRWQDLLELMDKVEKDITVNDFELRTVGNSYKIIPDSITPFLMKHIPDNQHFRKDRNGRLYRPRLVNNYRLMRSAENSDCIYKGVKQRVTIVEEEEIDNAPRTINPKIIEQVVEMLENKIKKQLILER